MSKSRLKNMKNLLALLALFAFVVPTLAQELRIDEIDDFTGESKKVTWNQIIGDNQKEGYEKINLTFSTAKVGAYRAFFLTPTYDIGCAGAHDNYAMLKFSDDVVIKLEDGADIDCNGNAQSLFVVTNELMDRIKANDAPVMIRLKQSEYYTDAKTVDADIWNAHWNLVAE